MLDQVRIRIVFKRHRMFDRNHIKPVIAHGDIGNAILIGFTNQGFGQIDIVGNDRNTRQGLAKAGISP